MSRLKDLEDRVDLLEDLICELGEELKAAQKQSTWLAVAAMAITLIVGLLQAAATWYK